MSDILSQLRSTAALAPNRSDATKPQAGSADRARAAAEDFEATFLASMMESMFAGVEVSKPFGGGSAETQFRSVLLSEYAKDTTRAGGIGIADAVYREILAVQEGQV